MTESYMQVSTDDALKLLGVIAAIDGRSWADTQAVKATAMAWRETIRRELDQRRHFTLTYPLAEDAVYAWYARETRRIMPAGILDMAQEIRGERLALTPMPDPPDHPAPDGWRHDAAGWEAMQAAGRDAIAAGGNRQDAADAMADIAATRPRVLAGQA